MTNNALLAEKLMKEFGKDMDFWWENSHPELSLEFPFAPSIKMPEHVSGFADSKAYLLNVVEKLAGLKFYDLRVTPAADPDVVFLQYKGSCPGHHGQYQQRYVTQMCFKEGKLSLFCEYWDTAVVTRAYGDLSKSF